MLRDIEDLGCSEEFRKLNFAPSKYSVENNKRSYPMYYMTRDGFTILAMGYTGEKAMRFKEANHYTTFCLFVLTMSLHCNILKERKVKDMAQTTVSIRMDDTLKKDFDSVCNDLGLSMTAAITMLAKKMTREKRIPFEVSIDPFYSDENMARLRKSIAQMESTGGTVHEVKLDD